MPTDSDLYAQVLKALESMQCDGPGSDDSLCLRCGALLALDALEAADAQREAELAQAIVEREVLNSRLVDLARENITLRELLTNCQSTLENGYGYTRAFIDENIPDWIRGDDFPIYWAIRLATKIRSALKTEADVGAGTGCADDGSTLMEALIAMSPEQREKYIGRFNSLTGEEAIALVKRGREIVCKCGNPLSMHRPEVAAHHSECTLEQFRATRETEGE